MTTMTNAARISYDRLSTATMILRHVAACHVENCVEGGRPLDVGYMAECVDGSIVGDGMWRDYYPHIERGSRAARNLLARSFNHVAIEREIRWVLAQPAETVARFIATAHPGELTARGIASRDRHLAHLRRFDIDAALKAARQAQGIKAARCNAFVDHAGRAVQVGDRVRGYGINRDLIGTVVECNLDPKCKPFAVRTDDGKTVYMNSEWTEVVP